MRGKSHLPPTHLLMEMPALQSARSRPCAPVFTQPSGALWSVDESYAWHGPIDDPDSWTVSDENSWTSWIEDETERAKRNVRVCAARAAKRKVHSLVLRYWICLG